MNRKIIAIAVVMFALTSFNVHASLVPKFENWEKERDHICMLTAYSLVKGD